MKSTCYLSPRASRTAMNRFLSNFRENGEELHTFLMYENDALVAKIAPAPYATTDKREIYSLSKSFCSTAVGFLIDEGKLSEDDRIVDLFPEYCPTEISENLSKMKLSNVMSMNTGHESCVMPKMVRAGEDFGDTVRAFLAQPVVYEPGTHFAYNTGATCLLSCIVEKISGMKLLDFLSRKLFMPLGITDVRWNQVNGGQNEGGCGIHVSCEDIAKLGLLYLHKGEWMGRKLLSDHWVETATSPISDNSCNGTPDWCAGYGYQFWVNAREGFRGDGAFGQLCVVLPERRIVFALQTELGNMQNELDLLMELAEHIHDADDDTADLCLPQYPAAKSARKTAGFEHTFYRLNENPMGFTGLYTAYNTEKDTYDVIFSNGCDQYVLSAGDGHWAESTLIAPMMKPKLVDLMSAKRPERLRIAASYEASEGSVTLRLRYLNCPHRIAAVLCANGDDISVSFDARGLMPGESVLLTGTRCR